MKIKNNFQYSDRYFNTDWQLELFKRRKDNGHDTWESVNFKIVFLIFSNIYAVGTHWYCLKEAIPMCTYNMHFQ